MSRTRISDSCVLFTDDDSQSTVRNKHGRPQPDIVIFGSHRLTIIEAHELAHDLHFAVTVARREWDYPGHDPRCHLLTHNGMTLTLTEWSRKLGLNEATIRSRLRLGCSPEAALAPVSVSRGKRKIA